MVRREQPTTQCQSETRCVSTSTGMLARNTLLNLAGQGIPLVVGVLCIPVTITALGVERFGLLSIALVVLGYFSVFDLGLTRATTKFVAEADAAGAAESISHLVWTSLAVQAMLGVVGGTLLALLTPLLVERVFRIGPDLALEARGALYALSASVPIVLVSGALRGALEALQRFDLVNAIRVPTSIGTYVLPLAGALLGVSLPAIVASIIAVRAMAAVAFALVNLRITPQLRRFLVSSRVIPRLLSFGGWVTVTSIISPILVYVDKLLIVSLLSLAAVSYYSAPYEGVTRLGIVATSLSMTLFPAFSAIGGIGDRDRLTSLFFRSVKYILVLLGPITVVIGLFSHEIVGLWLGEQFVEKSGPVLSILSVGVLANSVAQIPFALLQGIGRPDIPAKIHLAELLPYVGVVWLLARRFGIAGAAFAWAGRATVDAILLLGFVVRIRATKRSKPGRRSIVRAGAVLGSLLAMSCALGLLARGCTFGIQLGLMALLLLGYVLATWRYVLDSVDKNELGALVSRVCEACRQRKCDN